MRAGLLYRRVTVQRATLVDDGFGQVEQWGDLFTTWANVVQEGGREFFAADTVQATRRVIFRMRYRAGVSVLDRIVSRGVVHGINDVRELGRAGGLELHTIADASGAVS